MTNRKFHLLFNKSLFIMCIFFSFFFGVLIGIFQNTPVRGTLFGKDKNLDTNYFQYYNMFRQTYQILQTEYVDPEKTDAKTLLSGAIKGMLSAIDDPYTDFLSPEIAAEFSSTINGTFYGVGIRIEMRNNHITIVAPISGTSAATEGLQAGDQIIEIDGKSTEGFTALEAVNKIRGKLGTSVELTILRPKTLHPFKVTLKRTKINVETVEYALISYNNNKIAYIKLIEFGKPTEKEFKKYLRQAIKEHPIGLILDVRNNPGGLLFTAVKIANMIIDKGLIVYTRGRIENENHEHRANSYETIVDSKLPIIILANQGSASASEILVGALKDTGRATFIGKNTFGKGSVQKPYELSDGSILKYTIAKYYTPAGNVINKIGIQPDIDINMWYDTLSDVQKTTVIQLQTSNIISDFLQNTPAPTIEELKILYDTIEKEGYNIPKDIIQYLVKQRQNAVLSKIYDLDIDMQLLKALEVISDSDFRNRSHEYKYFETPKTISELQELEKEALEQFKKNENKY